MNQRFKGKAALVTGGASGIGKSIATMFAKQGCSVMINYHSDNEEAEEARREIKAACESSDQEAPDIFLFKADVSSESEVVSMFQEAKSKFDSLVILVNNAGIQQEDRSHELESETFDNILGVNLRGAFLCSREAIKHFLDKKFSHSCIINISSVHEKIPRPHYLAYAVSKGGLGSMTRTLALEYAREGIRVNGIAPGATRTSMNQDWKDNQEDEDEVAEKIPLRRVATPQDIASVCGFLASAEAQYITGQTLYVDGGMTLYQSFEEPWS